MPQYTIASYNIEWMNRMFTNDTVDAGDVNRANAIAAVIQRINPHVLAICEAANAEAEHQHFIDNYLNSAYTPVLGTSRGAQNLVFYIRAPFQLIDVDDGVDYYTPWNIDIDDDGVTERFSWERRPLEAVFRIDAAGGPQQIRFILVHAKSKGVFDVVDLAGYQNRALGNRKKLAAQALRLRARLDDYVDNSPIPTIVLGDMNDGPGLDAEEKTLGRSFVETTMGSVFEAGKVFHNALYHLDDNDRWTADFPDPIVNNPLGFNHRVWIDHILLSPDMVDPNSPLRLVPNSGAIDERDPTSRAASDHYAVYCTITDD